MPLQWPLVGRHEELELFAARSATRGRTGSSSTGQPGVGKTRLADQCLATADGSGRNVARATATEGSRSIPLGALAHLLPAGIGDERGDLVTVMSEVRPVLLAQAANGPFVLFVDDLHLMDATSATFVEQLVDADLVFLVATVRSGGRFRRGWMRCGIGHGYAASISKTWTGLRWTRCCTWCCAVRSRRRTITDDLDGQSRQRAVRARARARRRRRRSSRPAARCVASRWCARRHAAPPGGRRRPPRCVAAGSRRCARSAGGVGADWVCRRWRTSSAATSSSCSIGPGC